MFYRGRGYLGRPSGCARRLQPQKELDGGSQESPWSLSLSCFLSPYLYVPGLRFPVLMLSGCQRGVNVGHYAYEKVWEALLLTSAVMTRAVWSSDNAPCLLWYRRRDTVSHMTHPFPFSARGRSANSIQMTCWRRHSRERDRERGEREVAAWGWLREKKCRR